MLEDMRKKYARLLKESLERIVKELSGRVERISIFGSYARAEEIVLGHSIERLCNYGSRFAVELGEKVKR